jgi:hypothetical protein
MVVINVEFWGVNLTRSLEIVGGLLMYQAANDLLGAAVYGNSDGFSKGLAETVAPLGRKIRGFIGGQAAPDMATQAE